MGGICSSEVVFRFTQVRAKEKPLLSDAMKSESRFLRWLLVALLTSSIAIGFAQPGSACAASCHIGLTSGTERDAEPNCCCCGMCDGNCGAGCCCNKESTPKPDPAPANRTSGDDQSIVAEGSFVHGLPFQADDRCSDCYRTRSNANTLTVCSLQTRHVRIQA